MRLIQDGEGLSTSRRLYAAMYRQGQRDILKEALGSLTEMSEESPGDEEELKEDAS